MMTKEQIVDRISELLIQSYSVLFETQDLQITDFQKVFKNVSYFFLKISKKNKKKLFIFWNVLEKHQNLSKAKDATFSAGSPSYWRKYIETNS